MQALITALPPCVDTADPVNEDGADLASEPGTQELTIDSLLTLFPVAQSPKMTNRLLPERMTKMTKMLMMARMPSQMTRCFLACCYCLAAVLVCCYFSHLPRCSYPTGLQC